MKFARLLILAAAVVAFSSVALADTVDPAIGIKGAGGSDPWTGHLSVLMESSALTGVSCDGTCSWSSQVFKSLTGPITNFLITFDKFQPGGFSFPASTNDIFASHAVMDGDSDHPSIFFSDGLICQFSSESCGGNFREWSFIMDRVTQGTLVDITSNVAAVPEPGTMILLGSGLAAMGLRRFRRNRNKEA